MNKWTTQTLEEIADFILGKMLDQTKNKGDLKPYLANINVQWGSFNLSDLREMRFTEDEAEKFSLKFGDILMCEGGEVGRCAYWKQHNSPILFQKAIHRIRVREKIDSAYLYYYFLDFGKRNGFEPYSTGSTIKHLPREQLAKIDVTYPDIKTQKSIANILLKYDDLIQINQQRIALLEEAAQRLYDEWFIKLRFPNYEQVPVVDGVPEGWEKYNLFDIFNIEYGFPFKASLFNETKKGVPAIRIRDIPDLTIKTYTTEEVDEKYWINKGDFLIGMDGIFHMNYWPYEKAYLVQRVCRVRPINKNFLGIIKPALKEPIKYYESTISGATVAHLGAKHLKEIILTLPKAPPLWLKILNSLAEQQLNILQQNQKLTQARDELLPRLMSGQLAINKLLEPEVV